MRRKAKKIPRVVRTARPISGARWLLSLGAIVLATFVVYVPSLDNRFTNWDDGPYVTENPLLAHPSVDAVLTTPVSGNYHPLTIWSLALNYRISRLDPASYHWLSLLLHLANTALVFLFIWKLSRGRFWTSAATSLFFGIHPMHVESVAWIAERKDILFAFFYLLGLIVYLRYLERRQLIWLGATLVAFVLSAASKPAAVVFPVTLLAIDFYRRRPFKLPVFLEKVPFFVVSLVVGIFTLSAQQSVGATVQRWAPLQRLLFASYGTVMYVVKLFVPAKLSAIYPYPNVQGQGMGVEFYVAFALVAILLPIVVYLGRRNRVILFGLAFFFINIVLVLQFFSVGGAMMADRYTYLPYIGLFFALSWWLDEPKDSPAKAARIAIAALLLLLLPISLAQTWRRCEVWRDSGTLWDDTIRKAPYPIADAYIHRAYYFHHETGEIEKALADYDRALALVPRDATVWCDRGLALFERNELDSAHVSLERSIALNPKIVQAQNNLGAVELRQGDPSRALLRFTRAIELAPRYRDAYANRALAYSAIGQFEKAIEDFRHAIDLEPANPGRHASFDEIGVNLQRLGRYREAVAAHDEAIRLAPPATPQVSEYLLHRSIAWWGLGDRSQAIRDAEAAERAGAKIPEAYKKALGR